MRAKNKLVLFLIMMLPVYFTGYSFSKVFANPYSQCNKVVGDWAWDTRAFPATIKSNGKVVGNDGGKRITATWTCIDDATGQIVVNWSTGYIDTLTISSDGKTMTGVNNREARLVILRRGSSHQSNGCNLVVGNWAWDTRAFPATIHSDGTVFGNDGGQLISATWLCIDPLKGQIVVKWNTGYTDTLTLSNDGNTLTGANNRGGRLIIQRR